jgi:hypothetical protein
MKKIILFISIMILSLSAATAFANTPDSKSGSNNGLVPVKTEIKLSGEDFNRLTKPDREIRKMDNSVTSVQEGRRRGRDRVVVVGEHHRSNGVIYIGGGTILLIILIILLV